MLYNYFYASNPYHFSLLCTWTLCVSGKWFLMYLLWIRSNEFWLFMILSLSWNSSSQMPTSSTLYLAVTLLHLSLHSYIFPTLFILSSQYLVMLFLFRWVVIVQFYVQQARTISTLEEHQSVHVFLVKRDMLVLVRVNQLFKSHCLTFICYFPFDKFFASHNQLPSPTFSQN